MSADTPLGPRPSGRTHPDECEEWDATTALRALVLAKRKRSRIRDVTAERLGTGLIIMGGKDRRPDADASIGGPGDLSPCDVNDAAAFAATKVGGFHLVCDLSEYMSTIGAKGGRTSTPKTRAAAVANLKKGRAVKKAKLRATRRKTTTKGDA